MTERFNNAVTKLYKAFNEGTLNANDCAACAVGNMLGHGRWNFNNALGDLDLNTSASFNGHVTSNRTGYTEKELRAVEIIFLEAHTEHLNLKRGVYLNNDVIDKIVVDKDLQLKGLLAVIDYLAKLDGIETPTDVVDQFKEVLTKSTQVCSH